uniref:Uncharacterized protein n=1 Tax=Octopus bimaculoides TaxID=37653 RepID=A0A0L8H996_OCTBM
MILTSTFRKLFLLFYTENTRLILCCNEIIKDLNSRASTRESISPVIYNLERNKC